MGFQPLILSGITLGKSGSGLAIGAPVTNADANAILTTDGSKNLSDKVLNSGQILIGSTGAAPVVASLTGTANQVIVTSGPGTITLALPQNIDSSATPTFAAVKAASLDTAAVGTLGIGVTNANVINIGNPGATVNIQGSVLYENVLQLQVKDPLITLNKGGGVGSAAGSGIELEEAGTITGYVQTSADRLSYLLKAPATAGIVTITPGAAGITLNQSSHNPVTLGTPSGLSLANQVLSLAVATSAITGALSSTDWSTFNNKQPAGNYVTALTGDGSASGPGSVPFTLATVNSTPGTTGSASSTSTITTNAKGLVTANTSTSIQITESQVTGLVADLASKLTSVSVASVNGLAGTSSGGSTPVLTLSTTVIGLLKGNGTAITAAVAGTDYQAAGNYLTALTGDGTAAGPGSSLLTLSTVNTTPGTFGSNSSVNTTTVNAKGLVTTVVNNPILITESQVTNLVSDLAGKQSVGNYVTALTGDVTASGPGSAIATLATVNAAPGTTGSASTISTITTNAKGLVTVNTSTPIQITESQVTNLVSDLAGKQPVGNYVTALTGDGSASGPGSAAFTLATVNLSPGVTGSASSTSTITTNGKGLVTANTSTPIQITESQVTGLVTDLASKITAVSVTTLNGLAGTSSGGPTPALTLSTTVTGVLKGNGTAISAAISGVDYQPAGAYVTSLTGDATGSGPGATALTLATVNAAPGTTGSASSTSIIVTNAKGLVTANTNTPIQISEAQVTNLVSDLAGKQPNGNYITALTGDATAAGPGSAAITLATVNTNVGTFNNVTVNAKGLVTAATNVSYITTVPGDVNPGSFSGLTNNTANQSITGLSFANSVSSFEALLNIQIVATANTYTSIRLVGTNKGTWASGDISAQVTGDSIQGLAFGITSGGVVTVSIGSVTGFTSGTAKYRAISLS